MPASSPAPENAAALPRVLAFLHARAAATADAARTIDSGLVLSTPSLPAVWSANQIRVTEPRTFEALVELADEQLAGFDYVHIVFEDQGAGAHLEARFRAARWKVERDLLMILSDAPDRAADTSIVSEAAEDEMLEVMARWHGEDAHTGADDLDQLVAHSRREARVHHDRLLGVRSVDGRLVAITKLRSDGGIAQVEDVYTVPEARGRGYARSLVTRAVGLARDDGADLIFIVADDADWPKILYGQIGFRPLGLMWELHRA